MQQPEDELLLEGAGRHLRHPQNLSTHCARHTFATLTLASGATIDNVAKMLGHANVNMTRRYAKVLDSSIMRDMEVVAENMAL